MPEFNVRNICWTAIWLAIFIIAVITSVLPLHKYLPAQCKILNAPFEEEGEQDDECYLKISVEVSANKSDEEFSAKAIVEKESSSTSPKPKYYDCDDKDKEDFEFPGKLGEGQESACWYLYNDHSNVHFFNELRHDDLEYAVWFSDVVSKAGLAMAGVFGFCSLVCIARMFKEELIRCCPRFVLRLWVKVTDFLMRRNNGQNEFRSAGRPSQGAISASNEDTADDSISRPPMTRSRRKIASLVESAKVSDEEVRAMHANGWSCCICLDVEPENDRLAPVSRLQCNHATHSECLRAWLEKGRAVCCLCNADVFLDDTKEATVSTGGSAASGYETGRPNSLEVEETDAAASSSAISVVVE